MLLTSKHLESQEDQHLASYACRSKNSKGRSYPEEEAEFSTAFQKDRDRILHSKAFELLASKSLIFHSFTCENSRTLLAHSIEVAQIARSAARALGANQDLVEAICLAQNLGYCPFGQLGEATLSRIMRDFGGYEHIKQSLRILTTLEHQHPDFPGLNLTWEVREGIAKYQTEIIGTSPEEYNPKLRGHLESQISISAKELVNLVFDLSDGLHYGLININQIDGITLWEILIEGFRTESLIYDEIVFNQIINRLINLEMVDLINSTYNRLRESNVQSVEELQSLPYSVVSFSEDMHRRNRQLKDFMYIYYFRHPNMVGMDVSINKIIEDIFKSYLREPGILPMNVQSQIEVIGLERAICDYIASMTDQFVIAEHRRLLYPGVVP